MRKTCLCLAIITILLLGLIPCAAAESPLDSYATGSFGNQQSLAVYTGPGEQYFRANNGKAAYGGGSARIYGVAGDWIMIGYGLSNGNYRIGYISAQALNGTDLRVPYLDLRYTTRRLSSDADLTDDTLRFRPTVAALKAGSYVLFLGYAQDAGITWAYVEVLADNSIMRGFIPASALE